MRVGDYQAAKAKLATYALEEGVLEEETVASLRIAKLFVAAPHHQAGETARRMAEIAVEVRGTLTLEVYEDRIQAQVSVYTRQQEAA